ncbi:hypothetical protein TcasGA2_TC002200 [Tribolium castaneum]|uniref:CCHC-type domain-containing protein n=1 Tax=Tribolium castaneum TaxID=7070 RepID=D6WY68_TRICA|nr:hypothetical protein TcasGA2_TC002200 [Tribolium castaneum]
MTKQTYASISKQTQKQFLPRSHAIVIDTLYDFKLTDYVVAIGTIIGPKFIKSALRIYNNRICIYLTSTELVNQLVNDKKTIRIEDKEFKIRKLITPAQRLVIGNVCTSIPHSIIENEIAKIGLRAVSSVTTLRARILDDASSHVESFRRQVFVTPPEDNFELPQSIVINFEDTTFRLFLSFEEITCFICKQQGHSTNRCPTNTTANSQSASVPNNETIDDDNEDEEEPRNADLEPQHETPTKPHKNKNKSISQKRLASTTSEEKPTTTEKFQTNKTDIFNKPRPPPTNLRKKAKIIHLSQESLDNLNINGIEELLQPIKSTLESPNSPYPLDFEQLCDFITNTKHTSDLLSLIKEYTDDTDNFINMKFMFHNHFIQLT